MAGAVAAGAVLVGGGGFLVLCARRRRRPGCDSLGCVVVALALAHRVAGTPAAAVAAAASASALAACGPPAVLPEVPLALLLPLLAGGAFAGA